MLRVLLRVPPICIVTVIAHLIILLSRPLRSLAPARQLRIRNAAFRWWGRTLCRLLGARVEIEGRPPEGSFFLVANHVSYVDIFLLGGHIDAAFIAKADLHRWPILGSIFAAADTIFVDRGRKRDLLRVLGSVEKCLDLGIGAILFPEGTSGKGDSILAFKPSLLQLPAARNLPVHYATLSYRCFGDPPPHELICWWGDAAFVPHFLRLLRLPSFEATLSFGDEPVVAEDRKELADQLRVAMTRDFIPIR